jgi:hypothetical protein
VALSDWVVRRFTKEGVCPCEGIVFVRRILLTGNIRACKALQGDGTRNRIKGRWSQIVKIFIDLESIEIEGLNGCRS